MLFHELVTISDDVARTSSRIGKTRHLAKCLRRLAPEEIPIAISYLTGTLRQGRIGIGIAKVWKLNHHPAAAPVLNLADVDGSFSEIAGATGSGSSAKRAELLAGLFTRATPAEQGFLVRLIVGELRQGALEGVMLEGIAQAADIPVEKLRRALTLTGNLPEVARTALTEGGAGLEKFSIELFKPVAPMLAQPAGNLEDALQRLGEASIEWKLDGARIQLHKKGGEVRVYSRNLNEVTVAVPEVVECGSVFAANSLILDGEAIALRDDGSPHPFQATMSRFGRKLDVPRQRAILPLSPFFFDCLYIDGRSLLDLPQRERFRALADALPPQVIVPRLITADPAEAASFLADARERGHEGVMAKSLDSPYESGRRGLGWLKVKPAQSLDLVVLAAEWGHGRRSGTLSNLHLGARDTESGGLVMLGKTFKGMTDAMLSWQTAKLLELEDSRDAYTVYVRPELVVEVAFSDIQASPRYPGGFALRFARVKRYRPDKLPNEADTVTTVRELFELQRRRGAKEEFPPSTD